MARHGSSHVFMEAEEPVPSILEYFESPDVEDDAWLLRAWPGSDADPVGLLDSWASSCEGEAADQAPVLLCGPGEGASAQDPRTRAMSCTHGSGSAQGPAQQQQEQHEPLHVLADYRGVCVGVVKDFEVAQGRALVGESSCCLSQGLAVGPEELWAAEVPTLKREGSEETCSVAVCLTPSAVKCEAPEASAGLMCCSRERECEAAARPKKVPKRDMVQPAWAPVGDGTTVHGPCVQEGNTRATGRASRSREQQQQQQEEEQQHQKNCVSPKVEVDAKSELQEQTEKRLEAQEGYFASEQPRSCGDLHKRGPEGYAWRRYGHKRLKYESVRRYYYHCAQKDATGCQARKVVDRCMDSATWGDGHDEVTLEGKHNHFPPIGPTPPLDPPQGDGCAAAAQPIALENELVQFARPSCGVQKRKRASVLQARPRAIPTPSDVPEQLNTWGSLPNLKRPSSAPNLSTEGQSPESLQALSLGDPALPLGQRAGKIHPSFGHTCAAAAGALESGAPADQPSVLPPNVPMSPTPSATSSATLSSIAKPQWALVEPRCHDTAPTGGPSALHQAPHSPSRTSNAIALAKRLLAMAAVPVSSTPPSRSASAGQALGIVTCRPQGDLSPCPSEAPQWDNPPAPCNISTTGRPRGDLQSTSAGSFASLKQHGGCSREVSSPESRSLARAVGLALGQALGQAIEQAEKTATLASTAEEFSQEKAEADKMQRSDPRRDCALLIRILSILVDK